ncbi:MAG: bifunctional metallophosphatase/5'-nucleotidase [Lachnospiraceae bacterium]|jgi:5'-nucleotidase/UDP-sugar diphosphatase|nr:bifunctional metallophosphatase/5'-nucleotidase [Lachnospiraceae bacterium]
MKQRWKKGLGAMLGLLICLLLAAGLGNVIQAEEPPKEMTVVFTHDLHSHLDSFMAALDGEEQEVGGFARIKTFIDEAREEDEHTLALDGGDFSMGTLYQAVYETQAAELRMLGYLGMDVTTMGNHEFDYRTTGLNRMLQSAMKSNDELPAFVLCNVDWEASLAQGIPEVEELKETFDQYGIAPYVMLDKGDIRVAVLGVFGKDALECAPTCELIFQDPVQAVKETVTQIREKEEADLIVCVSHSGTWPEADKSEDEILAKEVPELDLIVSGHTHTALDAPIVHGNTAIVSTGEYGIRAGKLRMEQTAEGRWEVKEYQLAAMTKDVEEDSGARTKMKDLGATIDKDYLEQFGYTKEQVLAYNPWKNPTLQEISDVFGENGYTNLLADAYRDTLNKLPEMAEDPVDVAVVPSGVIRDVFAEKSDVTVSDVFNAFSLGIGPDGVPGYPLISIYLTGAELKTAAEVDASISPMMPTAQLFMSGLNYTLNPNRLILNKVTKASLSDMEGNEIPLEDDKLYRVVADLYSGQMLGAVTDMSYGILSIVPKDAQGNPVEDLEDYIVYDNGQEMKAWVAIARYVESMGDDQGEISEYYSQTRARKVIDDDKSIGAFLRNPNKIALIMAGILLAVIVLLVLLIIGIVKLVKYIRRKRRDCFR